MKKPIYKFWIDMIPSGAILPSFTVRVFAENSEQAFQKVKKSMPQTPEYDSEPWKLRVKDMEEIV